MSQPHRGVWRGRSLEEVDGPCVFHTLFSPLSFFQVIESVALRLHPSVASIEKMPRSYPFLDAQFLISELKSHHVQIIAAALAVLGLIAVVFDFAFRARKDTSESPSPIRSFGMFFYANFLKPHTGDSDGIGQQAALESFYKAQVVLRYEILTIQAKVVT